MNYFLLLDNYNFMPTESNQSSVIYVNTTILGIPVTTFFIVFPVCVVVCACCCVCCKAYIRNKKGKG